MIRIYHGQLLVKNVQRQQVKAREKTTCLKNVSDWLDHKTLQLY